MIGCLGRLAATALIWITLTNPGYGFGGALVQLPASKTPVGAGVPVYSPLSGLTVSVDTRWFDVGGYRPVRFRFTRARPAKAERELSIVLTLGQSSQQRSVAVSKRLTFGKGETAAETVVLCPMNARWDEIVWEVRVDGMVDRVLTQQTPFSLVGNQPLQGFRVLRPFVDGPAPVRTVQRQKETGLSVGGRMIGSDWVESEPLDDWLGYSSADVLRLDLIDLRDLAEKQPDRVRTIRHWVLAGGTAWVEGVGDNPEGYLEVDRLLGVATWRQRALDSEHEAEEAPEVKDPKSYPSEPTATETKSLEEADADESKSRAGPWRTTAVEDAAGWGYQQLGGIKPPGGAGAAGLLGRLIPGLLSSASDTRGWYATRKVGFGRVLAFNQGYTNAPSRLKPGQSEAVRNTWYQLAWTVRHGLEPGAASPQFGNLLIPGVGVAPVTEFQVLITLFVLAIGPLNYWLLWRRQQLQLLVVTVPLCALAATLALAAYAALSDGFGVQARARSITLLNQATGEAASWSRVSHYVSMAPDEPATLPEDCTAYPITPAWEVGLARGGRRVLDWDGQGQTLSAGWLPSRTATQHLVIRVRESPAKLTFTERGGSLRVTNGLGAPIELLLVRPERGSWRRGESIDVGSDRRLEELTRLDAMQAYRTLSLENEPTFPIGAGKAIEQTLERLGNARAVRRMQRNFAAVSLTDSLGEQTLSSVSGLDGGRSLDLPPRSYVAVTRRAVETPLGWDSVEEVGSFHVIVGRW